MRRVVLALLMSAVWVAAFLIVWRSTGTTDRPCNDMVTVPVAAACVMPGPSVFPALPMATLAAVASGAAVGVVLRHGSAEPKA